jgi:hypothetical protein
MLGVRLKPREIAPANRFAFTSNTRTGGIQLSSSDKPPGNRVVTRGRANTGARLVASGLSEPAVRCSADSGGRNESSTAASNRVGEVPMPASRLPGTPSDEKATVEE